MPINIERPRSALLRGVHITEFKGHVINPDPIILQETDLLLEEFLSPTKLKALTGVNDLKKVEYLEMIVDTSETSLGNFGIYLPNLKQLKLNGSHVPRIRDLGTSLVHLRVLWLSRSGLADLDGIPALNNLRELYLAYNEIVDISPCSMLEHLECLDLEG
jgi:Leucine-rich repeat (LRR) protein